jgi:protein-S-isoprenylcysteine O-methyltransferase Ste14
MLYLAGVLEGVEIVRQRRRGVPRSIVASSEDRDPTSTRLLALTWWPAGVAAIGMAATLPRLDVGRRWSGRCAAGGAIVTGLGIASLGRFFVGHVLVQPGQSVVSSGPYRWLRHPSYTGQWMEMVGVGLATGNVAAMATCGLLPLVGITARIAGEERELAATLTGYEEFRRGRSRLVPFVW